MNRTNAIRMGSTIAALFTATSAIADQEVGGAFTFQGVLAQNGEPVDDYCDFLFGLYDDPVLDGPVGATVSLNNVPVVEGRFTVVLNAADEFGTDAFTGRARWLEIAVRCPAGSKFPFETLSPRQPLTAAPYALYALNAEGAYWMLNSNGTHLTNSAGDFVGIHRDTRVTGAEYFGVQAPVDSGYGGMYIRTDGADGWPLYGYRAGTKSVWHYLNGQTNRWHLYNSGNRLTVDEDGDVGIGTIDPQHRLHVETNSGYAIFAQHTGGGNAGYFVTNGNGTGVLGQTESGVGVAGFAGSPSGTAVQGVTPFGIGVHGRRDGDQGTSPAVYGETHSEDPGAVAVKGSALGHALGATYGVLGESRASQDAVGVRGECCTSEEFGELDCTGSIPTCTGVEGDGELYGVHGIANNPANGEGVRGQGHIGVHGSGGAVGVHGESPTATGVLGESVTGTGVEGTGDDYGVHGVATGILGEGVRGEGTYGVYGIGTLAGAGVVGEAGSAVTPGVWAIGWGTDPSDAPALRADGGSGPAIFATGSTGVKGEGTDTGVAGTGTTAGSYGGFFSNLDEDGVALGVSGPTIMSTNGSLPAVPAGVVLAVDGKIMAEELEVQLSEDWPDFVFADDYTLPRLTELEAFVREHRHLPDVPSAKDVARDGIKVGAMQATLLQKVEELTLHVIELDKKLASAERENEVLRARIASIEAR